MRTRNDLNRSRNPLIALTIVLFLLALTLYWFRPVGLIHGTLMLFYMNPLTWILPLFSAILIFLGKVALVLFKSKKGDSDNRGFLDKVVMTDSYRESLSAAGWAFLVVPCIMFFAGAVLQGTFNSQATYNHYTFTDIKELPQTEAVRIMPFEVAEVVSSSGFDSSTDFLGSMKIVGGKDKQMDWTFGQLPTGFFRKWTKNAQGMLSQPADITSRRASAINAEFKYAPGQKLTDGLKWQLYKKNFFTQVPSTVFMVNDQGDPVIVAPYIKYEGFFTKVPVLGGVYVVSPNGDIEDLSPEEAADRPFLVNSGQIIPDSLARDIQESYAYKNGIWNKWFVHDDQTSIPESESGNDQPYLNTLKEGDPQWISTAEPHGGSFATKAVFLTDSVTAETQVWQPASDSALSGNARALEVVKGLAIPGVTFDKFSVIEPRPIVYRGHLQFVISVVPNNYNGVTKTVIVDAADNKVVAIFNHDTDPKADLELKKYIAGDTQVDTSAEITETDDGSSTQSNPGDSRSVEIPSDPQAQETLIKQLIETSKEQQRLLEELAQSYQAK